MSVTSNRRIAIHMSENDSVLCSRLNAEKSVSGYIKDLIRLDIDAPECLKYKHENNKPMSLDSEPFQTCVRFYYGKDDDILDKLEKVGNAIGYIKSLIYWDIGIEPPEQLFESNRGKRGVRSKHPQTISSDLRSELSMTVREFADLIGVAVPTIYTWESGRSKPSLTAQKLMTILKDDPELANKIS